MTHRISTKNMSREQWLLARRAGIGGSDIGAILGLSKYKTPVQVWLEKIGSSDDNGSEAAYWGIKHENMVAQEYAKRLGVRVRRCHYIMQHKNHSWMIANIDRNIVGQRKALEVKTSSAWRANEWGPSGSDFVPEDALVQVAWYMAVMDYDSSDLAALLGGNEFRHYCFSRDADLEAAMIAQAEVFWRHNVQGGVAPDPVSEADCKALWDQDNGRVMRADDRLISLLVSYQRGKDETKRFEVRMDDIKCKILTQVKEHAAVRDNDNKPLCTYLTQKNGTRVLRLGAAVRDYFASHGKKGDRYVDHMAPGPRVENQPITAGDLDFTLQLARSG